MGLYNLYSTYSSKVLSDLDSISPLRSEPFLLSPSLRNESLYLAGYTFVLVSVLHLLLLALLRFVTKTNTKLREDSLSIQNSYQATNLCVNLTLGIYGAYTWLVVVPAMSTIPPTHKIIGFQEFIPFSAAQLGYNLWSLPMGLVTGESKVMLGHHVAAFFVAYTASFLNCGYRYYSPFFLGFFELSSVPLAIMNFFKNNKELANKYSPISFTTAKVSFAVLYLLIRVILGTPQMYDNVRIASILLCTCESNYCKFSVGIFITCGYFLALLQFLWGFKVVKGLFNVYKGDTNSKVVNAQKED